MLLASYKFLLQNGWRGGGGGLNRGFMVHMNQAATCSLTLLYDKLYDFVVHMTLPLVLNAFHYLLFFLLLNLVIYVNVVVQFCFWFNLDFPLFDIHYRILA